MTSVSVRFLSAQRPSFVLNPAAGNAISVGDVRAAVHKRTGVLPGDWRVVRDGRCLLDDTLSLIESPTTTSTTNGSTLNGGASSIASQSVDVGSVVDTDGAVPFNDDEKNNKDAGTIVVFVLIRARIDRLSCETPSFLVRIRGLASTAVVVGHKRKSRTSKLTSTSSNAKDALQPQQQQTLERTVKVSVTDSVRALKRRIARLSCCPFPADEQEIIFQGRKLDTSCYLGDQLLINNPIVRVVHRPNETKRFPLTLKLGSSLIFRVPITRKDTVAVLRRRLHRGYTFPGNLSYALVTQQGIPMRSGRSIGHYALTGSSVIRIMFPPASKLRMRMNRNCNHGRVKAKDMVENIKKLRVAAAAAAAAAVGTGDLGVTSAAPAGSGSASGSGSSGFAFGDLASISSSSSISRVVLGGPTTAMGTAPATANTDVTLGSNAERTVVARILAKAAARQRQQRQQHQKNHMAGMTSGHPLRIRIPVSASTTRPNLVVGMKRSGLTSSNVTSKRIKITDSRRKSAIDASKEDIDAVSSSSSANMTQGRSKRRCIDRTVAIIIGTGPQAQVKPLDGGAVVTEMLSDGDTESATSASQVLFASSSGGEDVESLVGASVTVNSNASAGGSESGLAGGRRRSKRCGATECRRKLPLGMAHPCRCGMLCCSQHMLDHQCSFDYKKAHEKLVSSELAMELSAKHRMVPKI